jgi:hypothetical protein
MRYLVGILAGVVVTAGVVAAGSGVNESSADVVEGPTVCGTYGRAMDDILMERFPMDWDCDGQRLTVTIRGPWTLGAADMETALEVLLDDLRNRELLPMMDGVVVEAGLREPSMFDTYDYGPMPTLWMMGSLVVPEKAAEGAE